HVARPGRDGEAGRDSRVVGKQGLEGDRDEDALVVIVLLLRNSVVYRARHRVPRAQLHPDAEAPLDLETSPMVPRKEPPHPRGECGLIGELVVNRRERGHGLVIAETEAAVEVAL